MTYLEWIEKQGDRSKSYKLGAELAWICQQAKIDHIREYLTSGMEVATENSEYWLALRDCLNELDGILK